MLELLLILPIWIILPVSLILIFIWISRVGIYHPLKSQDNPHGEPFLTKFRLIFEYNLYLSLAIAASVYITITTTVELDPNKVTIRDIAMLTFIISLAILLIQRVLANPPSIVVNYIHFRCPNIQKPILVSTYKEYIISFFYSFICAAILIALLLASYNILINKEIGLSTQNLTYMDFITVSIIYVSLLLLITFIGECILYLAQPEQMED